MGPVPSPPPAAPDAALFVAAGVSARNKLCFGDVTDKDAQKYGLSYLKEYCPTKSRAAEAEASKLSRSELTHVTRRSSCYALLFHRREITTMYEETTKWVLENGGLAITLSASPRFDEVQMPLSVRLRSEKAGATTTHREFQY